MSGNSYESTCPNCQNNISEYSDHKPFSVVSIGPCLHCGFYTSTEVKYLNLEELNEIRDEYNDFGQFIDEEDNLLPLTELPEQDETL
jgi:hypothetical protein